MKKFKYIKRLGKYTKNFICSKWLQQHMADFKINRNPATLITTMQWNSHKTIYFT